MTARICLLAGLVSGVAAGFLLATWVGLAALCIALLFLGWASLETPHGPV